MSGMAPPDRKNEEPSTSLTKDAIQIDRGSSLFFVCFPEGLKPDVHQSPGAYFCGTDEYVYRHFFADFGPLHLGHVHSFCRKLRRVLELQQQQQGGSKKGAVYVYSSDHPHRRSNAAGLVLAFAVSLFKTCA